MQDNSNPTRRVPLRTIEDLERREQLSRASERDAVQALAALLRELAVRLPADSKLIRLFAHTANSMDGAIGRSGEMYGSAGLPLLLFTRDLIERFEAADDALPEVA